jgi:hypothetical protein
MIRATAPSTGTPSRSSGPGRTSPAPANPGFGPARHLPPRARSSGTHSRPGLTTSIGHSSSSPSSLASGSSTILATKLR